MAEKKKKDPKFGGKRSLKDTSGNKSIGFEDTYLGDLLGFDGKMGTKGKPGLLASLKGARRKKPGTATTTTKKKKKPVVKKTTGKSTLSPEQRKRQAKTPKVNFAATGGEPSREQRKRQAKTPRTYPKPQPTGTGPDRGPQPKTNARPSKPLPEKVFTPTEQKKNLKRITLENFKKLTPKERKMMGLPKTQAEAARLLGRPIGTPIYTGGFKNSANMNKGGMAKKKPTAKMMGGGMAKSGYMYGGSVTKKKPMNKGGMAKKK